jgi:oligopeptide/dipeptide ABC transporter ATP-binding protein
MTDILLEVKDIKKYYPISRGLIRNTRVYVKAVDKISFTVNKGDVFSLVGESGCGKTTTSKLILRLEKLTGGSILYRGNDISQLSGEDLKGYHRSVQAMFQDPYGSLNPRMRIRDIIAEPIENNLRLQKTEIDNRVNDILNEVKLNPESNRMYPHEFSGGQRQRIALARAIVIKPNLVILDEPVSALDVSVRAQLMNLLMDIQQETGLTYIIIAHDLATVRHMSNRIAIMYLGKIVEYGDSETIFKEYLHPYTKMLFSAALPSRPGMQRERSKIIGEVPNPINPPIGCYFHPRCLSSKDICREIEPKMEIIGRDHYVACHLSNKLG